jgi:hypothetical protein
LKRFRLRSNRHIAVKRNEKAQPWISEPIDQDCFNYRTYGNSDISGCIPVFPSAESLSSSSDSQPEQMTEKNGPHGVGLLMQEMQSNRRVCCRPSHFGGCGHLDRQQNRNGRWSSEGWQL